MKLIIFTVIFYFLWRFAAVEYALISQKEAKRSLDELVIAYFYPHTVQERTEQLEGHLAILKHLQEKLNRSWIAKRFVDYTEEITERALQVEQKLSDGDSDASLTFSTPSMNHVNASPDFEREMLVNLGWLVDERFHEEECGGILSVEREGGLPVITFTLTGDECGIDRERAQAFVNEISELLFDGKRVKFKVGRYAPDYREVYTR